MGVFEAMHAGVDRLRELPGVRQLRRAAYENRFREARAAHLFNGVFATFEEAQRAAPPTAPIGYDHVGATSLYLGQTEPTEHDYAAFFWLAEAIAGGATSIVDLGGNVGFKFIALRSRLRLPPTLRWVVVDVPAVVRRGEELQAAEAEAADPRLAFSADVAALDGADVVYASGTLQYLPSTLAELLDGTARKPRRIVVNTTPIHERLSFFTINNIGSSYCPYRVQSHPEFVAAMAQAGYVVRDRWLNGGKAMRIPFQRDHDVPAYSGYCFDLSASPLGSGAVEQAQAGIRRADDHGSRNAWAEVDVP
jgi:putative methyltransferase (TIGR04325 family)